MNNYIMKKFLRLFPKMEGYDPPLVIIVAPMSRFWVAPSLIKLSPLKEASFYPNNLRDN